MGNVYQSLREVVQDTFQRSKANSMAQTHIKTNTLNDEVKELEKFLLDKIGRLNARIKENEDWVAGEAKHAEDLIDSLRLNVAELETKLTEAEDATRRKDLARQQTEESLNAKIHDLQNDLKTKERVLESRDNELSDLKSTIDRQMKRAAELEEAVQTAKAEAAAHSKRSENLTETLQSKIAGLEAQLTDSDLIVRIKDSTIENLTSKIQDVQSQLMAKEELLTGRDAEINTLKSQLKVLTKGLEEMAFLFRTAEALAAVDGQSPGPADLTEAIKAREEKPAGFENPKVTPSAPDVAPDIVSDYAFGDIIRELAEFTNVIGIVASVIVREHVMALGESMEKFPKARLPELLASLSREILDENRKAMFRERLGKLQSGKDVPLT